MSHSRGAAGVAPDFWRRSGSIAAVDRAFLHCNPRPSFLAGAGGLAGHDAWRELRNDVNLRGIGQAERKWYLILGGAILAFFSAIMVATQDGTRGFGIAIVIGALVLYGLNEFLGRRMREPLTARGIDVERLRVE